MKQRNPSLHRSPRLQGRLNWALLAPGADAPAPGKYPVALPEKFDGAPASFPMFLAQAKLYIQGRARNFPDDRTKVHFLISLLKDQAAKWALPLLRQDSPLLADYTGFFLFVSRRVSKDFINIQSNQSIVSSHIYKQLLRNFHKA
uniref:DUF4939 domain-containing protein n=1 Tax=Podarcis muralis TaxID=64176 RepID=A0A670KFR6_PODMU